MNYFKITEKKDLSTWDGGVPASLKQESHIMVELTNGKMLVDYSESEKGKPFEGPLKCILDDEDNTGTLPRFFLSPAFIVDNRFLAVIQSFGVENIELFPVEILNEETGEFTMHYSLVNILDPIACAVLGECESNVIDDEEASPSIRIIHDLVVDGSKLNGEHLFIVREDTDCIVFSEQLKNAIEEAGHKNVIFDPVKVI